MKFIEFHSDKCDECFKCLRSCPTKAITFVGEKRSILDSQCIKCGLCLTVCTHGALETHQDLMRVKNMLRSTTKVVASIAPSFAGLFRMKAQGQMVAALKKLGFSYIEETARGAELVSKYYEKYIKDEPTENIITSCCPSTTYFLEKKYNKALDSMIPIISPMVAHGRDIKERYGEVKVVFIGPCVAKKSEVEEFKDAVDAAITFKELESWFEGEGINLNDFTPDEFDTPSSRRSKAYPIGGSLWQSDLESPKNKKYEFMHVDGAEDSEIFLKAVDQNLIKGYCAEVNICKGGCINGPEIPLQAPSYYERVSTLKAYVHNKNQCHDMVPFSEKIEMIRTFEKENLNPAEIDEGQVFSVMMSMDKYTEKDQIDCGACGYKTCYDKAVAVVQGRSDMNNCMDRMRHKVESLQNIIFENSPNAICILNEHKQIQDINPAFRNIFNQHYTKLNGWPIGAIIGSDVFDKLDVSGVNHISEKLHIQGMDKTFFMNLLSMDDEEVFVGIFTDITLAEQSRVEMNKMKIETINTCQSVIDKQMRVAQEIASLLGETTAETKVNLNRLKQIVMSEEG